MHCGRRCTPDRDEPMPMLPRHPDDVLRLAAQTFFDTFAATAMGAILVDRDHRIAWISEGYKQFLPALGHAEDDFVGRRVEEVVPNTLMAQVIDTGQPILIDLLSNRAGTFVVSRLPLRDAAGEIIGAIGFVLMDHPETTMQPLLGKFNRLQAELDRARRQLAAQRRPRYSIASFVGASAQALEVKRLARRVASSDSSVLLLGETGTGKEVLAQAIHAESARAARPFVGVNIAAVPESLLEAEFFGVAPGAYTGADRKGREGKFKLADGGTLFLDEIGEMPLAVQSKLLRVLQEQEVEALGSNRVERIDVRVIAATSRNLPDMMAEGRFRADLYYRLAVLPIRLPPLRERLVDLEALADALMEDIARRSRLPVRTLAPDALDWLARQPWPGNIRQLRNTLEQAVLMHDERVLRSSHFASGAAPGSIPDPESRSRQEPGPPAAVAPSGPEDLASRARAATPVLSLAEQIRETERRAIAQALAATEGNRAAAARRLGLSRSVFYERLARASGTVPGSASPGRSRKPATRRGASGPGQT
jgi:transcriptional regulator with PAS, ATPase and Fis domain